MNGWMARTRARSTGHWLSMHYCARGGSEGERERESKQEGSHCTRHAAHCVWGGTTRRIQYTVRTTPVGTRTLAQSVLMASDRCRLGRMESCGHCHAASSLTPPLKRKRRGGWRRLRIHVALGYRLDLADSRDGLLCTCTGAVLSCSSLRLDFGIPLLVSSPYPISHPAAALSANIKTCNKLAIAKWVILRPISSQAPCVWTAKRKCSAKTSVATHAAMTGPYDEERPRPPTECAPRSGGPASSCVCRAACSLAEGGGGV